MKIVNLTPHTINYDDNVSSLVLASAGEARCAVTRQPLASTAPVKLCRTTYGTVTGLPAPVDGTMYVVSLLVRQACPDRADLCSPGELIRDQAGRVVGCKSFDVH